MSRATQWLDRDDQRRTAYQEIQAENESSVNVYRHITGQSGAGFKHEAPDPQFVFAINCRIDEAKNTQPEDNQDSKAQESLYTALTDSRDVRLGDMWQYYDLGGQQRFLRVVRRQANEAGTSAWLQEMRKERWPGQK